MPWFVRVGARRTVRSSFVARKSARRKLGYVSWLGRGDFLSRRLHLPGCSPSAISEGDTPSLTRSSRLETKKTLQMLVASHGFAFGSAPLFPPVLWAHLRTHFPKFVKSIPLDL